MNEFITKLAIDAGFIYDIHDRNLYGTTQDDVYLNCEIEKLVELTVRKCIEIIRQEKWNVTSEIDAHISEFNKGIEYGVQALYATTGVMAE
jgi:hypothetical protein